MVKLANGSLAFFNLLVTPDKTFMGVHLKDGIYHGVSNQPLDDRFFSPTSPAEIEVLYPQLTAEAAIAKVQCHFGENYMESIRFIQTCPELLFAIGPIKEIHPAKGENSATEQSGWNTAPIFSSASQERKKPPPSTWPSLRSPDGLNLYRMGPSMRMRHKFET
jgi:hypothetical protein